MEKKQLDQLRLFRNKVTRFMMMYKFALAELETKIKILNEEFHLLHEYNPIEHTKSRVKSPESIMEKLHRKGGSTTLSGIRETIKDIAGLRITCSFIEDIYWISDMLKNQTDLHVVQIKDYIEHPKPNGYRSLHLLIQVPVFMSDRQELVYVEVQIRTIAMDFWASLEHKIFYKYDGAVPPRLLEELKDAADSATALDRKMEKLHHEIETIKSAESADPDSPVMTQMTHEQGGVMPEALLRMASEEE
ncbi:MULTISPECIES: GTP pyrophosphokinase [Paenibacillus]|uniref:GTP pyrophosphokinase n=1 Tax=Paenibacillus TaxID=44249 RepID=UPI0022B92BB4|nr:GTP pyrophosphokinase family protein [Paenibacillus caseinilyticus]MCZ8522437.1 GTP pyrophosphokinase family protein [Paenibacillus caseinilyticus]